MMFKYQKVDNNIYIKILGIKISYKDYSSYHKNKLLLVDNYGNKKRIFSPPNGINIIFQGENSTIEIFDSELFENVNIIARSDSFVQIKKPHEWRIKNLFMEVSNHCNVIIDENFNCVAGELIACGYNNSIKIGRNCMFARNFLIRTDDGHTLFDLNSKKAINKPQDVTLGEHIWLGESVSILKGVSLNDNVVVATHSVVTKPIEDSNIIIGGVPAKIVKKDIGWDRENFYPYSKKNGEI